MFKLKSSVLFGVMASAFIAMHSPSTYPLTPKTAAQTVAPQSSTGIGSSKEPQTLPNEGMVLNSKNMENEYPYDIIGMKDEPGQSVLRSKELGAVAQYILGGNEVDEALVDKKTLSLEINDYVALTGKYFKEHPDLKGTFITHMVYYPGYKKPFQIPLDTAPAQFKAQLAERNKTLKDAAKCNKAGFCSVFATENVKLVNPSDANQKINMNEFAKFMSNNSTTQNIHIYHANPKTVKPILFIIYQGINGHLTTREFVQEDVNRMKKKIAE